MKNTKHHKFSQYPIGVTDFNSISDNIVKAVFDEEVIDNNTKLDYFVTSFRNKMDYIGILMIIESTFLAQDLELLHIDMNIEDFKEIYDFEKLTEQEIEIVNVNVCTSSDISKNTIIVHYKDNK